MFKWDAHKNCENDLIFVLFGSHIIFLIFSKAALVRVHVELHTTHGTYTDSVPKNGKKRDSSPFPPTKVDECFHDCHSPKVRQLGWSGAKLRPALRYVGISTPRGRKHIMYFVTKFV